MTSDPENIAYKAPRGLMGSVLVKITDELVTRVTNEILRLIGASGQGAAIAPPGCPSGAEACRKPPLLVVGPQSALSEGCLASLASHFELVPIRGLDQGGRPKAPLLVTSLGLQALVQVASGDEGCTEEGRAILAALLDGQPAVALESGLAWRALTQAAPRALVSLYQTAETHLKNAGLKIAKENELLAALTGKPSTALSWSGPAGRQSPCPQQAEPRKIVRVLTEPVVSNLFPNGSGGPLLLKPGDILTPLARDWLLARKIQVTKE
jgi:hypothetical protein